ncbi:hypothetical protein ACWCRD_15515 [Streptomyces sp. NPDC002092]
MSAEGPEAASGRSARGQFPEVPEERRIALERFLARRPELVLHGGNLLRRPDITPLAVEICATLWLRMRPWMCNRWVAHSGEMRLL